MAREEEGQTVLTCAPREEERGDVSCPIAGFAALVGIGDDDLKGGGAAVIVKPFREEAKGLKLFISRMPPRMRGAKSLTARYQDRPVPAC